MNEYYKKIVDFQEELKKYVNNIFRTYGKELVLRLEEYNLLQNKHNCIESSTAIGFVLEEFIVSKLDMYTHCDESEFVIDRFSGPTGSESYDCYCNSYYGDNQIKLMVNIKAMKEGQQNNAIAAITQLHKNYCKEEENTEKAYIVFKIIYSIKDGYEDDENRRAKPRHIYINRTTSYCLEEVDLSKGHKQDNRSWSNREGIKNNGRLQISDKFRRDHIVPENNISYSNTKDMIENIVNGNK